MARRMAEAARADAEARQRKEPAMSKLALLPEVTALLNRGGAIQESIVDPENDLLRSITFFLEPTPPDGALPAFNIQKELFAVLPRLPIGAEELRSDTRLGQCVLFYTKSKKPVPAIKRQAERLLTKWMGLIIKRPDDYRQRDVTSSQQYVSTFSTDDSHQTMLILQLRNGTSLPMRTGRMTAEEIARERALQDPTYANRARIQGGLSQYTIRPENRAREGEGQRALNSKSDATFRKIQARSQGGKAGSGKR
jgi:transcription factor SPN1